MSSATSGLSAKLDRKIYDEKPVFKKQSKAKLYIYVHVCVVVNCACVHMCLGAVRDPVRV